MATVEPHDTSAGRRYRVRYRKPDHLKTTKRGFRTEREAELLVELPLRSSLGVFAFGVLPLGNRPRMGVLFLPERPTRVNQEH